MVELDLEGWFAGFQLEKGIPGRKTNKCKNMEAQKSSGQLGNREIFWPKHGNREGNSSRRGARKDI